MRRREVVGLVGLGRKAREEGGEVGKVGRWEWSCWEGTRGVG